MPRKSSGSILEHLPDLSDASLQIPTTGSWDNLLTNDDEEDFFKDMDDSFGTPTQIASKIKHAPLTLSQITPKPPRNLGTASARPLSSDDSRKPDASPIKPDRSSKPVETFQTQIPTDRKIFGQERKIRPQSKVARAADQSSRSKFERLKDGAGEPTGNSNPRGQIAKKYQGSEGSFPPVNDETSHRRDQSVSKVPKDGVTFQTPTSVHSITAAAQPTRSVEMSASNIRELAKVDDEDDPDLSSTDLSNNSIVVERLVTYSQNLAASIGSEKSSLPEAATNKFVDQHPIPPQDTAEASAEAPGSKSRPLSLSEIPPRKAVVQDQAKVNVSPPRPTRKRPHATSSSREQPQKRGKRNETAVLQPSLQTNANVTKCNSSLGSDHEKAKTKSTGIPRQISHPPTRGVKGKAKEGGGTSRFSGKLHSSPGSRDNKPTSEYGGRKRIPLRGVTSGCVPSSNTKVQLGSLTKPIEFNFRLNARMEARKTELEDNEKAKLTDRRKLDNRPPVPDFKTLHAVQEAGRALRKQITPTFPVPIELKTSCRAKARHEFDGMMKEKERAIERALEEKKKELEAEEEKVVREIRRRAIPKAHKVPEWYREAPKRKERGSG